jgi:hypothetical protein
VAQANAEAEMRMDAEVARVRRESNAAVATREAILNDEIAQNSQRDNDAHQANVIAANCSSNLLNKNYHSDPKLAPFLPAGLVAKKCCNSSLHPDEFHFISNKCT